MPIKQFWINRQTDRQTDSLHLRVYDKDESPCAAKYHLIVECGVEEINLTRKVPDLEADKGTVGNILSANLIGAFQKESLVGWHLVEHDFLNGRLATSPQAHEQDPRFHLAAERITEPQHCTTAKHRNTAWEYAALTRRLFLVNGKPKAEFKQLNWAKMNC